MSALNLKYVVAIVKERSCADKYETVYVGVDWNTMLNFQWSKREIPPPRWGLEEIYGGNAPWDVKVRDELRSYLNSINKKDVDFDIEAVRNDLNTRAWGKYVVAANIRSSEGVITCLKEWLRSIDKAISDFVGVEAHPAWYVR